MQLVICFKPPVVVGKLDSIFIDDTTLSLSPRRPRDLCFRQI
jgi:hypothetical protein